MPVLIPAFNDTNMAEAQTRAMAAPLAPHTCSLQSSSDARKQTAKLVKVLLFVKRHTHLPYHRP